MITYADKEIPLNAIKISQQHWARDFTDEDIEDLADSIMRFGQVHAITVRKAKNKTFELLGGERRYLALKKIGVRTARCSLVTSKCDDRVAALISLTENLHTRAPSDKERREGLVRYKDLLKDDIAREAADKMAREKVAGKAKLGRPKDPDTDVIMQAAADTGVSPNTARRAVKREEKLCGLAQMALDDHRITIDQADILASLPTADQIDELNRMVNESQTETRERVKTNKLENESGPTEAAVMMLNKVIKDANKLALKVKAFMEYVDSKEILYGKLRKLKLDQLRKAANSTLDLVAFVETD